MPTPLGRIYLDHAATTPCRSEVIDEMNSYLKDHWHNPSTIYRGGRDARKAYDRLRDRAAALIGASSKEVIFNSGGSEGDNQALLGAAAARGRPGRVIISNIEHSAIMEAAERLEEQGHAVDRLEVGSDGIVDPADLEKLVREDTFIASVMTVNNEIGTLQPIEEIAAFCRERGVLFHTDAVQAIGYFPVRVHRMKIDMLSLAGHKIYGPRGVGLFYAREGLNLPPMIVGGGQELGRRAGTENMAGVAGFVKALELACDERDEHNAWLKKERDEFIAAVMEQIPDVMINGDMERRAPNNANLSFLHCEGETLVLRLDAEGLDVSAGSACSAGSVVSSRVIRALNTDEEYGRGAVRFTFGRMNETGDGKRAAQIVARVVGEVRAAREDGDFV